MTPCKVVNTHWATCIRQLSLWNAHFHDIAHYFLPFPCWTEGLLLIPFSHSLSSNKEHMEKYQPPWRFSVSVLLRWCARFSCLSSSLQSPLHFSDCFRSRKDALADTSVGAHRPCVGLVTSTVSSFHFPPSWLCAGTGIWARARTCGSP